MESNKLTIMSEMYRQDGTDIEVEGLTVIVDGVIKQAFDKIKEIRSYKSYNEVLRDILFEGINTIITQHKGSVTI